MNYKPTEEKNRVASMNFEWKIFILERELNFLIYVISIWS